MAKFHILTLPKLLDHSKVNLLTAKAYTRTYIHLYTYCKKVNNQNTTLRHNNET